jgi:hypothetical protein
VLQKRHRMSLQDLQSRHQAERKVTTCDIGAYADGIRQTLEANNQKAIQAAEKKGKQQKVKAVTAAAVALAELDERHEREEAAVRSNTNTTTATTSTSTRSTTADAEEKPASIVSDADAHEDNDGPKVSKAQKKRVRCRNGVCVAAPTIDHVSSQKNKQKRRDWRALKRH